MEELLRPMQEQLESLQKAQDASRDSQMEQWKATLEARKKTDDEELKAMADKPWKAPFDAIGTLNTIIPYKHDEPRNHKMRYDPTLLSKFRHDGDVEE